MPKYMDFNFIYARSRFLLDILSYVNIPSDTPVIVYCQEEGENIARPRIAENITEEEYPIAHECLTHFLINHGLGYDCGYWYKPGTTLTFSEVYSRILNEMDRGDNHQDYLDKCNLVVNGETFVLHSYSDKCQTAEDASYVHYDFELVYRRLKRSPDPVDLDKVREALLGNFGKIHDHIYADVVASTPRPDLTEILNRVVPEVRATKEFGTVVASYSYDLTAQQIKGLAGFLQESTE